MTGCASCRDKSHENLGFSFTMAFQPIVDVRDGSVYAHEALVRGANGEGAATILSQVTAENRYVFDQACRVRAIELARRLGMNERLSINFLPNAVYQPAHCLRTTLTAARKYDFPLDRIIFEVSEDEKVVDHGKIAEIVREYKNQGLLVAFDDFGAGWSGLNLLADLQPNIIKLDMALTRNIDQDRPRRAIVGGVLQTARELDVTIVAEGVETLGEYRTLADMGVSLFQGYLFARPAFETLAADIVYPS